MNQRLHLEEEKPFACLISLRVPAGSEELGATEGVAALTPTEAHTIQALVQKFWKANRNMYRFRNVAILSMAVMFWIVLLLSRLGIPHALFEHVLAGGAWLALAVGAIMWRRQKKALRGLATFEHPCAIQPLARTLADDNPAFFSDARLRKAARVSLTRLLPRMQPEQACGLFAYDWRGLLKDVSLETADEEEEYQRAVLAVVEQFGPGSLCKQIERLVNGSAKTPAQQRIQSAAQTCLPLLQARRTQEQANQTLLRPADTSTANAEILLRPTQAGEEVHAETLLRPSSKDL